MDNQHLSRLIVLFLCGIVMSSAPLFGQWETLAFPGAGTPFPDINDVAFFDEQQGVGVGKGGVIVRTENGGESWTVIPSPVSIQDLSSVRVIEGATAIAVGHANTLPTPCGSNSQAGVVLLSQDGGRSWTNILTTNYHLLDFHFPTAETGYIAADCGRVLKSTDGGHNWAYVTDTGTDAVGQSIYFVDAQTGFVSLRAGVAGVTGLFKTEDGGDSWTDIAPSGYTTQYGHAIFVDSQRGYFTAEGDLLETTDGGLNWNLLIDNAVSARLFRSPNGDWYHSSATFPNLTYFTLDGSTTEFQVASDPATDNFVRANSLAFTKDWIYAVANGHFYRTQQLGGSPEYHYLEGRIARDGNGDCQHDSTEVGLANWVVWASGSSGISWTLSDSSGAYAFRLDTGSYEIQLFAPNETWSICQNNFNLDLSTPLGRTVRHFSTSSPADCPQLHIALHSGPLLRCQDNRFYLQYDNRGSGTATAATATLTFDPALQLVGSSLPATNPAPRVYEFALGDLPTDSSGQFWVDAYLDCTNGNNGQPTLLGQTHCVEAKIRPDSVCTPTNPAWNGADLEISGTCRGDSVVFIINNKGIAALDQIVDFVIIEDHVLLTGGTIPSELGLGDTSFVYHPNGSTLRMEVDQVPFHPRRSFPSATIEACGTNPQGGVSLGYVTQYSEDDQEPSLAILCQESREEPTAVLLAAYPKGYDIEQYITPDTDLEYVIHFRNDGPDTVRQLEIFDTLSPFLDLTRIQPPVGTHPFRWALLPSGVLHFTFDQIVLPPSGQDVDRAYGSIQFSIPQYPGNVPGTLIEQRVGIVMDYELRATAQYEHLIETDFLPPLGNVSINGTLQNSLGLPMVEVPINLGDGGPVVLTDSVGHFSFANVPYQNRYRLFPQSAAILRSSTAHDLYLLHHHFDGRTFENPVQRFRADLNRDDRVDERDREQLLDRILFRQSNLEYQERWRFLPHQTLQNFPPTGPRANEIINPTTFNDLSIVALLPGDLNGDLESQMGQQETEYDGAGLVRLQQSVSVGDDGLWEVQLRTAEARDLESLQLTVAYAADWLEWVPEEATDSDHYLVHTPVAGKLTGAWWNPAWEGRMEGGELLLRLYFRPRDPAASPRQLALRLTALPTVGEAYGRAEATGERQRWPVQLEGPLYYQQAGAAIDVRPNPGRADELELYLGLREDTDITLSIYNSTGQTVARLYEDAGVARGQYRWPIPADQLSPGLYYLRLVAATQQEVLPFVVYH